MTVPPGWGSLPCPGGTSKLPENSPRRIVGLHGALCSPLMAVHLSTYAPRSAGLPALVCTLHAGISPCPWQKESLRYRKAGWGAEPILRRSVSCSSHLPNIPEGPGLCLSIFECPFLVQMMPIAGTEYLNTFSRSCS